MHVYTYISYTQIDEYNSKHFCKCIFYASAYVLNLEGESDKEVTKETGGREEGSASGSGEVSLTDDKHFEDKEATKDEEDKTREPELITPGGGVPGRPFFRPPPARPFATSPPTRQRGRHGGMRQG